MRPWLRIQSKRELGLELNGTYTACMSAWVSFSINSSAEKDEIKFLFIYYYFMCVHGVCVCLHGMCVFVVCACMVCVCAGCVCVWCVSVCMVYVCVHVCASMPHECVVVRGQWVEVSFLPWTLGIQLKKSGFTPSVFIFNSAT